MIRARLIVVVFLTNFFFVNLLGGCSAAFHLEECLGAAIGYMTIEDEIELLEASNKRRENEQENPRLNYHTKEYFDKYRKKIRYKVIDRVDGYVLEIEDDVAPGCIIRYFAGKDRIINSYNHNNQCEIKPMSYYF